MDVQEKIQEVPPVPSFKLRQRQMREDAILDLAHKMMATQGYMAMAMDDLAAGLGISTGTLYQHFASKEELVIGVALRFARGLQEFLAEQAPTRPAIERLEEVMRWRIERRFRDAWPDIEAIKYVVRSQSRRRPELQAQLDEVTQAYSRLVDAAKEQGAIRPDVSTAVLAQLLETGIAGGALDRLLEAGCITLEQLSDSLIKILLDGIRPE